MITHHLSIHKSRETRSWKKNHPRLYGADPERMGEAAMVIKTNLGRLLEPYDAIETLELKGLGEAYDVNSTNQNP